MEIERIKPYFSRKFSFLPETEIGSFSRYSFFSQKNWKFQSEEYVFSQDFDFWKAQDD